MRMINRYVVGMVVVVAGLAGARPALAQTVATVTDDRLVVAGAPVDQTPKPATKAASNADRPVSLRLEGGLVFHAFSTVNPGWVGFFTGAGVDATPFANKRIAFEADGAYYRYRGGNNLTVSGNVLYYVTETDTRPYVGGGLVYTHTDVNYTSGGGAASITVTDRNWEIIGGVAKPLAHSPKVVRGEVRVVFRPANIFFGGVTSTVLFLGGVNF